MNRKRIAATVVGLALAVGVALAILFFTTRVPDADRLPDEVAARLEKLQTVKGRLLLGKDDQTLEYELWVQRPRHLRAEAELKGLDRKAVFIMMFNAEEAWMYDPLLNIATVTDRTKEPPADGVRFGTSLLETMPEDVLAALRAGDIQIIGEEPVAGRNALRVQMLLPPTQNPLAQVGEQLTVWLDRSTYYPLAIEGDTGFRMRFEFIKFNETIDPLTFVFFPPPGATVRRIGE
jgi:outer membrane lipoprotein-sorting protein